VRLLSVIEQNQRRRRIVLLALPEWAGAAVQRILRSLEDETDRLLRSEVFESGSASA
jgi:hypothetical protein